MATFATSASAAALSPIPCGLKLDAASHTYRFNGELVPGVTDSLKQAGLIDYSGIPQHVLDRAAERGKAVHLALEYLDRGTLDRDSVSDELLGYIEAYERFCIDSGFYVALSERSRFHAIRRYAGTFDRTGVIGHDDAVIVDFKTGEVQDGHFLQLAAYAHFFPHPRRFRLIALKLSANRQYRVYEAPASKFDVHSNVFFSTINAAHWRMAKGGR